MKNNISTMDEMNFNLMYENICNFIAISQIGDRSKTIQGLIKLCLCEYPNFEYENSSIFSRIIKDNYGLTVDESELNNELDHLEKQGILIRKHNKIYILDKSVEYDLKIKIKGNIDLENEVKKEWFRELKIKKYDVPDLAKSWIILQDYLNQVFRVHGIQATALLDPSIDNSEFHDKSLTELLNVTLKKHDLKAEGESKYKLVITDFMSNLGNNNLKTQYISQLADGAFNFFSINISPDVSYGLIKELNKLTIFLDTNFLFGILNLHNNSQVQVSRDLLAAIKKHNLPFDLMYHPATEQEMRNTLRYHLKNLKSHSWNKSLSQAVAECKSVSGVELKFHEKNAIDQIDVKEFVRTYEHFDVLLKTQGINKFDDEEKNNQTDLTQLFSEYNQFLEMHNRFDKSENTIQHDVTLLGKAIEMRSDSKSSLEAKVIIISCDYLLFRFDKNHAHKNNRRTIVLLPSLFFQILRPYIPLDNDFNSAFASTFSLPDFRSINGASERACTKVLKILATYKDLPKETAIKILSNSALLDGLNAEEYDAVIDKKIQSILIEENKDLLEENCQKTQVIEMLKESNKEKEDEYKKEKKASKEKREELESQFKIERNEHLSKTEELSHKFKVLLSVFISFLISTTSVLLVNLLPWVWLMDHKANVGIQILFVLLITSVIFGIIVKKWRVYCFIAVAFNILISLITILTTS